MSHVPYGSAPPAERHDVGLALALVVGVASAFTALWLVLRVAADALPGALLADGLLTVAASCALAIVVSGARGRALLPSVVVATLAAGVVLISSAGPAHLLLLPAVAGAFVASLVSPRVGWTVAVPLAAAFVWPVAGLAPPAAWGAALVVVVVPVAVRRWRLRERLLTPVPAPPSSGPLSSGPLAAASSSPDVVVTPHDPPAPAWVARLSDRQRQVLALVAGGLRHAEVATELGLTPHQVGHDLRRARELSGLPTTRAVVAALPEDVRQPRR